MWCDTKLACGDCWEAALLTVEAACVGARLCCRGAREWVSVVRPQRRGPALYLP